MIIKNINVQKLHSEFNKKEIYPNPVFELENGDGLLYATSTIPRRVYFLCPSL